MLHRAGERLCPAGEPAEIRRRLSFLIAGSKVTATPPSWVQGDSDADGWLILPGGDFCAPLRRDDRGQLLAITLLARGSMSVPQRAGRNRRRRARAGGRRGQKAAERRDPRPPIGPSASEWAG